MPYGDGTGPLTLGRRGLGRGPCGRGLKRRYGPGRCLGFGYGIGQNYNYGYGVSKEDEIRILKNEKEIIERELNSINKRIEELER